MKKTSALAAAMKAMEAQSATMKAVQIPPAAIEAMLASTAAMEAMQTSAAAMKAMQAPTAAMEAMLAPTAAMEAMQASAAAMKAMQAPTAAIRVAQALIDSPSMKAFENMAAQNQRLLKGLSATEKFGGLAEIAGFMQHQPALNLSVSEKVGAIHRALYELDSSPEDYDPVAIETLFDELIDDLIDLLGQAVEKIEIRSVLLFAGWIIPLLLSLYLYQESSIQTQEFREDNRHRHNEAVDAIFENTREAEYRGDRLLDRLEKLENKIDELSESENPFRGTFYIVARPVPLTAEQRFHGTVISWLLPGQEVELIERSGKWIRVIAYDFATGTTEVGWIMKKYLRRLQ